MRFFLYYVGNPNVRQDMEPAGDMAEFPICNVSRRDAGSYKLPAPRPSISVSPSGVIALGRAVTISCQCRCEARWLFLYKDKIQIRELDAAGDGGEFTIPSARWADGGVYMCQSRSRSEPPNWSDPSDIVRIIVAELIFRKPSISLHPSGGVALGGAVTVRCRGRHQNMRFLLYKDGNPNVLQDAEPAGDLAEFPIRSVNRRDAGNYSCYYHEKWYPFTWSHPSDSMELVVAGELPSSVSALPAAHPAGYSGAGTCARGQADAGPVNQWGWSTELLRGAEPAPLAAGGTQSSPPKTATFFFLCTPLIRGSLRQWDAQSQALP
ncbi:immunoglobulin superfamily member 1-like [Chrysemys picta bellii]|uniref:immunoglobulin superfamily member 1-like n=1 Tax=Chrysemys picta bellii TaxID=8478 RepID=UPI0032B273E1